MTKSSVKPAFLATTAHSENKLDHDRTKCELGSTADAWSITKQRRTAKPKLRRPAIFAQTEER